MSGNDEGVARVKSLHEGRVVAAALFDPHALKIYTDGSALKNFAALLVDFVAAVGSTFVVAGTNERAADHCLGPRSSPHRNAGSDTVWELDSMRSHARQATRFRPRIASAENDS